jgi:hypothetical protein
MKLDNTFFKQIELNDNFITAIKRVENSNDVYFLVRLKQNSNIFSTIEKIEVIVQNNNTFNTTFPNKDLSNTQNYNRYSTNYLNNELLRYYSENFEGKQENVKYSENAGNSNSYFNINKSNIRLIDDEIYFIFSKQQTNLIKNLQSGGIRIIVKKLNNEAIFDSNFIVKNFASIYQEPIISDAYNVMDLLLENYMLSITSTYDDLDNTISLILPSLNISDVHNASVIYKYISNNNIPHQKIYHDVSVNDDLTILLIQLNESTNLIAKNIFRDYKNEVNTFNFEISISFNLSVASEAGSFSIAKSIYKEYNRSSSFIYKIFNTNKDKCETELLSLVTIDCDASFSENFDSLRLEFDTNFANSFFDDLYIRSLKINNKDILSFYVDEKLKIVYSKLDRITPLNQYFNRNIGKTVLYVDARNIYVIKNISLEIGHISTQTSSSLATSRNFTFDFDNKDKARGLNIEKFFKLREFNLAIKDLIDIDIVKNVNLSPANNSVSNITSLVIKNIQSLSELADSFGYKSVIGENSSNIVREFINNAYINVSLKTSIEGTTFYKNYTSQIRNEGTIINNRLVFSEEFLEKIKSNHYESIQFLSKSKNKRFDFLKEKSSLKKEDIISKNNSLNEKINLKEDLEIRIIPVPYEISKYKNVGIDEKYNIVDAFNDLEEVNKTSLLFYNYVFQINPNFSYGNFLKIKESYFSPEIDDGIFRNCIVEYIHKKYSKRQDIFKRISLYDDNIFIELIREQEIDDVIDSDERKKFEAVKSGLIQDKFHNEGKLEFIRLENNNTSNVVSLEENSYTNSIKSIKTKESKNIINIEEIGVLFNNIKLSANILDEVSNFSDIKAISVTLCLVPYLYSITTKEYSESLSKNDLIFFDNKENRLLRPSFAYYNKHKKTCDYLFKGISESDFKISQNKKSHNIELIYDTKKNNHNFFITNHYLYLREFFEICINNGYNLLKDIKIAYNVSVLNFDNESFRKDYTTSVLEILDEKIYTIDNLSSIRIIKNNKSKSV